MAIQLSLKSLISVETVSQILKRGLDVAETLGLPVSSWRAGDPTRTVFQYLATILGSYESVTAKYIASGFLDLAEGEWLTVLADQVFGVTREEGSNAAENLTLQNTGAGFYVFSAGDLTFSNSSSGKTYHSTSGGSLGPGSTLVVGWVADEVGSDSSAAEDEIDTLITTFTGVSILSSVAGLGLDETSDPALRIRCRESLGPLSPNGPAEAYAYVAKNQALTGSGETTKTKVVEDSDTGDVVMYLAGANGAVSGAAVTAVQNAVAIWSTPLCITPDISSASNITNSIVADVYLYDTVNETDDDIEEAIEEALDLLYAEMPISGHQGALPRELLRSTMQQVYRTHTYDVVLTTPATDLVVDVNEIPRLSGVTINVHQVAP